jgi:hypothetical protein
MTAILADRPEQHTASSAKHTHTQKHQHSLTLSLSHTHTLMSATTSSSLESSFQCEEEEGGDTQSTDNNNCCLDNLVAVGDEAVAVDDHLGQHPSLQSMCVIDCDNDTRIVPNGPPAILSNECFEGKVMLLVRTPDVDDDDADCDGDFDKNSMTLEARRVSQSFKGKKRRFEFQFQVRLKRVPTGPLFLGCELEQAVRVGTITKGLVNILLAMVREDWKRHRRRHCRLWTVPATTKRRTCRFQSKPVWIGLSLQSLATHHRSWAMNYTNRRNRSNAAAKWAPDQWIGIYKTRILCVCGVPIATGSSGSHSMCQACHPFH